MFFKPFVSLFKRTVTQFSIAPCVFLGVMTFATCMVSAQIQTMPKGAQAVTVVANAATQIKGPRRIAVILPVSGPYASMGVLLQQGYSLGEAVIKQSVLKNAEIRYFDSGQFKDIQTLVSEQVAPWMPDVIVGPYTSEEALALDQAARALQIPVITPVATIDKLNQNAQGMVYRLAPPQYKIAQTASRFLQSVWQDWGIDKVIIL
ncbi:MAG: penicillin-binding protein activator, partial [Phycisphaeraceae bacterium]|nr:penicillin-binding protein activator [Phycisphaeraceae bacterium]